MIVLVKKVRDYVLSVWITELVGAVQNFVFRSQPTIEVVDVHHKTRHDFTKLNKANKCLFIYRSLRKEGFDQGEVDRLFSALVLPNFTYGLSMAL